jgi:hypothetical protein
MIVLLPLIGLGLAADTPKAQNAKREKRTFLAEGMEFKGSMVVAKPNTNNAYRIKKDYGRIDVDTYVLKIKAIDGSAVKAECWWHDGRAAELEGTVSRRGEFQMRFTVPLRKHAVAVVGGSIAGQFGPNWDTLVGEYRRPNAGRLGRIEASLIEKADDTQQGVDEPSKKKPEKDK